MSVFQSLGALGSHLQTTGIEVVDPGVPLTEWDSQGYGPTWKNQPSVRKTVSFIARNVASVPLNEFDIEVTGQGPDVPHFIVQICQVRSRRPTLSDSHAHRGQDLIIGEHALSLSPRLGGQLRCSWLRIKRVVEQRSRCPIGDCHPYQPWVPAAFERRASSDVSVKRQP